jgi:DNA-binding SARP family transcriptional activator
MLARVIADDGRWDQCAWLREPPGERPAAGKAIVDALELRCGMERGGQSPASVDTAFQTCGSDSVLVVELTRRCSNGLAGLLEEARRHAERVGAEIIVATANRIPPSLARAGGIAIPLDVSDIAAAEGLAMGLDEAVIDRIHNLTRGRDALLHDLATAKRWSADLIATAAAGARSGRGFVRKVTRVLLDECWADEREALEVAVRTGYWHPQFSAGSVETESLRPWLVPLEHDWGWVRPVWRSALRAELAKERTFQEWKPTPVSEAPAPSQEIWQPALDIRLFGGFEIRVDGQPVDGSGVRLGTSLIRYLLLRPGLSCPRDVLIETFWPDSDPDRARNRLQVAFSSLRKAIRAITDTEVIEFFDGGYRINPALNLTIDLAEFEQLTDEARRFDAVGNVKAALNADRRAVRLYRGDLCADLPYEEWTVFPRERVRLAYGDVLDRLARNQWDTDDLDGCIATAERMLEQDPCREDAHRLLMRSYAAQQRPHQALRQFDACRRVLQATLGTNPSRTTVAAYLEIRDQGDEEPP